MKIQFINSYDTHSIVPNRVPKSLGQAVFVVCGESQSGHTKKTQVGVPNMKIDYVSYQLINNNNNNVLYIAIGRFRKFTIAL